MRRKKGIIITSSIIIVLLIVAGVVFGLQWVNHTGIFHKPGQIVFDDSLQPEQRDLINSLMAGADPTIELNSDVAISTITKHSLETIPNSVLYNILVPVTDFYSPLISVDWTEAENFDLISILELTSKQKLLAIDGEYYLDTLNSGAFFEYLTFAGDNADVVKITTLLAEHLPEFPTKETLLTFAQTGVTALSRGMNAKLNQAGDASYFAANIGEYLRNFDLTHTSNESSFSALANNRNICSAPSMIDALTSIGLDIVELTGNHNQDCGNDAALSTLQTYAELGIKTVGGGANATLAAEPLILSDKGTNITMLGYNLSTGGYTLGNTPGANFYTTEKARTDIAAAKARGDIVIVDVQYYECNNYDNTADSRVCDYANSAAGDQIGLFREIIDLGADVVVGTSAHQPQTYEVYNNGVIYYGLGNLFFDQIWWPGTTRSLILAHYFWNGNLIQTRIVPTIYGDTMQTTLMDNTSAEAFIERLNQARPVQ